MSLDPKMFLFILTIYIHSSILNDPHFIYAAHCKGWVRGEAGQFTQLKKWNAAKSHGGGGVFNRDRGYSLYEHAAMHISVYTEAFDSCIHRIEYLNKNKRKKTGRKQEYATAEETEQGL